MLTPFQARFLSSLSGVAGHQRTLMTRDSICGAVRVIWRDSNRTVVEHLVGPDRVIGYTVRIIEPVQGELRV